MSTLNPSSPMAADNCEAVFAEIAADDAEAIAGGPAPIALIAVVSGLLYGAAAGYLSNR